MTDVPAVHRGSRPPVVAVVLLAALVALGALSLLAFRPPAAAPADVPPAEFSAARVDGDLREIARRPHPLGTPDNDRVRDHVVAAARAAGADVRVEVGDVALADPGKAVRVAVARNVVATVPGTDPGLSGGRALLLVSHYDSVPTGPGAADDGAAVASMLEAIRVLKASGGVRNDVVFLFTDGEELGSLGARSFVRKHGVDEFGAVLNWEARGSRGPVVMFETSTANAGLVDAFAGASSRPIANSLAYEVYRRMPNYTDFTVFRDAGATGLNAAFIESVHDYHSPNDDVDTLDRDTVQHHGESMTGLIAALGERDLRTLDSRTAVYFDVFGRVLVHYPAWVALVLAAVAVVALGLLVVAGVRRGRLRVGGAAAVAGTAFGAVVVTAALCFGLWWLVTLVRPGLAALPLSEPYDRGWFIAAFTAVAVVVLLLVSKLLRGRNPAELIAGGLLLVAVLLVAVAVFVPGATYLFQWPLLAGLPALWWAVRRDTAGLPLAALAPAVTVALFAPVVSTLTVALGIKLVGVAMALVVLAGVVVLPLLAVLPRPGLLAAAASVVALALFTTSALVSGFDEHEPRPDGLVYLRDVTTGQSSWLTGDPEPDDWTGRVLGTDPERLSLTREFPLLRDPVLRAPAPPLPLAEPSVTTLADTTADGVRTVRLRVDSARRGWRVQVSLPRDVVRACTAADQRVESAAATVPANLVFEFYGGAELTCEAPAGAEIPVDVADFSLGLPPEVEALVGPRPEGTIQVPSGYRAVDSAIVRRVVRI
ncbi:M20/M25/M40 family metallo-hydrolase [Umezawaea endophytica]|uniref:Vacuolar membrane protease n=1 Tax=Umezawaea endophytica TaxID=1654476 RepID=A0A9X2VH99_9PSEU|nr:M20/M25/M40 family metallo-hydrolase [Umezawaea endophytica]MCS7476690.1 M20/M25/M40 family metallo-hydrolase [Umezawaea endophytica]